MAGRSAPGCNSIATHQAVDALRKAGRSPDGEPRSPCGVPPVGKAIPAHSWTPGRRRVGPPGRDAGAGAARLGDQERREASRDLAADLDPGVSPGPEIPRNRRILKIPVGTVKSRLHAALAKLQEWPGRLDKMGTVDPMTLNCYWITSSISSKTPTGRLPIASWPTIRPSPRPPTTWAWPSIACSTTLSRLDPPWVWLQGRLRSSPTVLPGERFSTSSPFESRSLGGRRGRGRGAVRWRADVDPGRQREPKLCGSGGLWVQISSNSVSAWPIMRLAITIIPDVCTKGSGSPVGDYALALKNEDFLRDPRTLHCPCSGECQPVGTHLPEHIDYAYNVGNRPHHESEPRANSDRVVRVAPSPGGSAAPREPHDPAG